MGKARQASLRPDREKLLDFLSGLRNYPVPQLKTPEMRDFIHEAAAKIGRLIEKITKEAETL